MPPDPLDLGSPAFLDDPYPLYRRLRDEAPVLPLEDGQTWLLALHDDVHAVCRDWQRFTSTPAADGDPVVAQIGAGDLLNLDPPRHDAVRKLIGRAFAPRAVRALDPFVRARARALLAPLLEQGGGDLAEDLAWPLAVATFAHVLGLPASDVARLTRWVRRLDDPDREAVVATLAELRAYLLDALAAAPAAGGALGDIAAARASGALRNDEAGGLCMGLVLAGTATVACLISNGLLVLHRHPRAMALARDGDVDWADGVEELLRFESPVQVLPRRAARPVTLHGRRIPAGASVLLLLASANRDERRHADADVLDLRRGRERHMALGNGVHFCLGAALARLEGRIAFEEVFAVLDRYEPSGAYTRIPSADVRGLLQLPVRIVPSRRGTKP